MSDSTSAAVAAAAAAVPVAAPAGGTVPAVAPAAAPGAAAASTAADAAIGASVLTDTATADPALKPDAVVEKPEGDAKPVEVKPTEFTDFTLPEGLQAEDATLTSFREEASKLGLSQEQAQALVTKIGSQVADAAQAQVQAWVKMNTDWQSAIKADPEIGGDHFEPMKIAVAKLFDDYVGPTNSPDRKAFNQALLLTGAGNNPAIVKAWARVAAAHGEGGPVLGNPPRVAASTADLLYPTHNQAPGASR